MRRLAMSLVAVAFFLLSAPGSPMASRDLPALFPIQQQGKWGFIDRTGKVVISPQFQHAGNFREGRAGVKVRDKFGFIDETGKVVIPPRFDRVEDFAGGLARVQVGGKWGFVDPTGKMVVSPRFTAAGRFSEGRSPVQLSDYLPPLTQVTPLATFPDAKPALGQFLNFFEAGGYHYLTGIINQAIQAFFFDGKKRISGPGHCRGGYREDRQNQE